MTSTGQFDSYNYWQKYHRGSNSSGSSGGKSDLDEDYLRYQPPPQYIPRNSMVDISSKHEVNQNVCPEPENETMKDETVFQILKNNPETKSQLSDFDWYYDPKFKESLQNVRTKSCRSLNSSFEKCVHSYQLSDSKLNGPFRRKYEENINSGTMIIKERALDNTLFQDTVTKREFPVLPIASHEEKPAVKVNDGMRNTDLTLKPKPANWKPPLPPRNNSDAEVKKPPLPPRKKIAAPQPQPNMENIKPPEIPPRKKIEPPLYLPPEEIQSISNFQEIILDPPSLRTNHSNSSAAINQSRHELLDEEPELSLFEKVWNYILLCKCCKSKCTGSMHL